jgi:hypothetical protein
MEKVILESPYKMDNSHAQEENKRYAKRCLKDSLFRGESPLASHLLYTQVLVETNYGERCAGISAGLQWYDSADACVVYIDRGISEGMEKGILLAMEFKIPIEFRTLNKDWKLLEKRFEYG